MVTVAVKAKKPYTHDTLTITTGVDNILISAKINGCGNEFIVSRGLLKNLLGWLE